MKIFVTGATGHVGFRVATALRRRGHHVLGLTRTDAGAARLARHEIHAVQGSLQDPGTWKGAEDCSTLVHAAVDYSTDTVRARPGGRPLAPRPSRGAGPASRRCVYTSGVWVYGSTGDTLVDETSPLAPLADEPPARRDRKGRPHDARRQGPRPAAGLRLRLRREHDGGLVRGGRGREARGRRRRLQPLGDRPRGRRRGRIRARASRAASRARSST